MSVRTAGMLAAAIVAVAGLAWGGVALSGHLRCQSLEEDYLNSVESIRQGVVLKAALPDNRDLAAAMDAQTETEMEAIEATLTKIYTECGSRAGRSAGRKGSTMLLDI